MIVDTMCFSRHSKERMEQRGIDITCVENIISNGDIYYAGDGAYSYWVSEKCYDKIIKESSYAIDNIKNKAVVVSRDAVVVTVGLYERAEYHWQKA